MYYVIYTPFENVLIRASGIFAESFKQELRARFHKRVIAMTVIAIT